MKNINKSVIISRYYYCEEKYKFLYVKILQMTIYVYIKWYIKHIGDENR